MQSQKQKTNETKNNFSSKIYSNDTKGISFKEILFYKYLIFMLIKKNLCFINKLYSTLLAYYSTNN